MGPRRFGVRGLGEKEILKFLRRDALPLPRRIRRDAFGMPRINRGLPSRLHLCLRCVYLRRRCYLLVKRYIFFFFFSLFPFFYFFLFFFWQIYLVRIIGATVAEIEIRDNDE